MAVCGVRAALLANLVVAVVDEQGRYRASHNLDSLVPPEPSAEDRSAAVDLSKQPIDKIFKLLAYEVIKEHKRPAERSLGMREFQLATELDCPSRLLTMLQEVNDIAREVTTYHLNITGTVGLYWLLHQYPEEKSWAWVVAESHERVMWKVNHHFMRLELFALDDQPKYGCVSPHLRLALMNSIATWRKIHGDYIALLWNGVAFGMLGDVTSWREVDIETEEVEDGPGGPPPNVSWSENIIFGNMWMSSAQKFLEYHKGELTTAIYAELARLQGRFANSEAEGRAWVQAEDGLMSSFEYMRRQQFNGWDLDKGLLRGLLRHVLQPSYDSDMLSVGEFAAGGGRYSQWLNETGLVQAYAFDGTRGVGDISGGSVLQTNLVQQVALWRKFDWVIVGVGGGAIGDIDFANGHAVLENVNKYASRGLVTTALTKDEPEFIDSVRSHGGLYLDRETTEVVRQSCEFGRFAKSILIFRAV